MRNLRWSPLLVLPLLAFLAVRCGDGDEKEEPKMDATADSRAADGATPMANTAMCPAAFPNHCTACPAAGLTCAFGSTGCCVCSVIDGKQQWYCIEQNMAGCPATAPAEGGTCTPSTKTRCEYCAPAGKIETRSCGKGMWDSYPIGCG